MFPLLIPCAIAIVVLCASIAFKSKKVQITSVIISVVLIASVLIICCTGFVKVTQNSHVVANIKIGDNHRDLFYDQVEDEYFYMMGHKWKIIYPQYRVIVDYDTAVKYVEQYEKLKEFDFANSND